MQTQPVEPKKQKHAAHHTLEALEAMDGQTLAQLYAEGRVTSLKALDGHPQGRMLAVRGMDRGGVFAAIRKLATASFFPWGGKSFAGSDTRGAGVNRVHLGGRHQLFHFHTHVGASVVDGAPAIILDYDLRDNPGLIRRIHDEVREVSPGLYLGPAMWKTARGKVHVLWFALDTTQQAQAIGNA
jgi:hypothetical protein